MNEQLDIFPKKTFILNEGQQIAHDWLVRFSLGEDIEGYRKVLLNGYAGTGKTFCINRVVESVRRKDRNINFGMTAPTHKAVKVLKKNSELADQLDFGTIHSFLRLKEHIDEMTGKVSYKPDFEPGNKPRKIDGVDVLIIDESSMLNDDLYGYIEDELRSNWGLRIIFMGDEKQIPPVGKKEQTGEGKAIPFIPEQRSSRHIHLLSLTEPQRQAADSPVIMYSVAIREQSRRQTIDFEFTEEMKPHLERLSPKGNREKMNEIFLEYFGSPEFEADPDYAKVISYTNKTTDWANREIRLLINHTDSLPKIIEDEKLIMDEPLVDKENKVILAKNMDVRALNVLVEEHQLKYFTIPTSMFQKNELLLKGGDDKIRSTATLKVYKCVLVDEEGKRYPIVIIHEDSEKELNEIRENIKAVALKVTDKFEKKTMWKQFYDLLKQFAWVKYNYAITGHKSQGSTYINTISMEWDIESNTDIEERNCLRYVAATRAKNKLWVIR